MKRIFICAVLLFLSCLFFGVEILGVGVKWALRLKTGSEVAYRSCDWKEGKLIFSDLVLFDSSFHLHVEKASIDFDLSSFPKKIKTHLTLDTPHLSFSKKSALPQPKQGGWLDVSITVHQGIFDWEGQVQFTLDHKADRTELYLDWGDASAALKLQKGSFEANLRKIRLELLKPWIPYGEVSGGIISGRIAFEPKGKWLAAHLKLSDVAFACAERAVEGVQGTLTYQAGVGAKWEMRGFGKAQGNIFPFSFAGREFLKSSWLDSELQFDDSYCNVSRDEAGWTFECDGIRSFEASWLQGALSFLFPECGSFAISSGTLAGKGHLNGSMWNAEVVVDSLGLEKEGTLFSCQKAKADLSQDGGSFILEDEKYDLKFAGMWEDWNAEARWQEMEFTLHGGWDGEKIEVEIEKGTLADLEFQGRGWIDPNLDASFAIEGNWHFLQKEIPFYCPILNKVGDLWIFDLRFNRKTWDLFRLAGRYDGKTLSYLPTSHLFGQPFAFLPSSMHEMDLTVKLPWKAILAAQPFFGEWGIDLHRLPVLSETALHFQFKQGRIDLTAQGDSPPFSLHLEQTPTEWKLDLQSDLMLSAHLTQEGEMQGFGKWQSLFETNFEGRVEPNLHCELSLSNLNLDLKAIDWMGMEGKATGGGHFLYKGGIEADLDFHLASFVVHSYPLENLGQIHLSYSSEKGVLLQGLHLHGPFDCVIDLLEYDAKRAHWMFHNAQAHLPASLLTHPFLQFVDKTKDFEFTADFDIASDFSSFACKVHEGFFPYAGVYHPVEKFEFSWKEGKGRAALNYHNHLYQIDFHMGDQIAGRVTLGEGENPLAIDWEYNDQLWIQSIVGSFSGIEASFHAEKPNILVGSAHLDFKTLSPLLPQDVANVFREIEMGQGYELKGRLKLEKNLPYFQGILGGKAIELFGFQFRTLLAQVDLGPEKMRIYDIKISDSAGSLKIDEILLEDHSPWTINIPNLTIHELRPSLLQRPGESLGPLSPLVVRELKVSDFKGILEEGKTYTAKGQLHFINSYKREETVFDLPANVLSRIVGLDLDLLIPVTGDLTFNIQDGYFNLLELTNAYSEGKRSQFFLETDPPPRMDLDGNLQIFIKMKQFVLLKITESFLISIDGVLDDPQYHLKKRRFFGLM